MRLPLTALAIGSLASTFAMAATAADAQNVQIPFTKTKLANGMVVIFSEDHAVPQVVVNVTYGVGSRMERTGRTGFAHLFEHLMFMGTRRAPTKAFDAWMEEAGGWNNAWTARGPHRLLRHRPADRAAAAPLARGRSHARPRAAHRPGEARSAARRRPQRAPPEHREPAVRRRGARAAELLWPEAHPYHHPVIGSHEDLEAATVADVKQFFATWYDPANASLVVAGDFDPQQAKALIDKNFGTIPSQGKPVDPGAPGFSDEKTTLTTVVRQTVPDNVELTKITIAWQSPQHFAPGDAELDLLASVLGGGKASRLYKTLVYDQKIAQEVSARQESRTLGSDFVVDALVRPGVDPAKVEKALFEQVAKVREKEVTSEELERARNAYEMEFVDRLQGVEERASLLNMYQAETGDPGYVQHDLDRYRHASEKDLLAYAKKVLVPDAVVVLTIVPRKEAKR